MGDKMKLLMIAFILLAPMPLLAATFSWTDDSGTVNFTEDFSRVPQKYRKKIEIRGDRDSQSAEAPEVAKSPLPKAAAPQKEEVKTAVPEASYGGKSAGAWQSELTAAQSELNKLDARIKALDAERKAVAIGASDRSARELLKEYNDAVTEYNSAYERFGRMLEAARKAGLPL
jgi:hypothetical protein